MKRTKHQIGYESGKTIAEFIECTIYGTVENAIVQLEKELQLPGIKDSFAASEFLKGKLKALKEIN